MALVKYSSTNEQARGGVLYNGATRLYASFSNEPDVYYDLSGARVSEVNYNTTGVLFTQETDCVRHYGADTVENVTGEILLPDKSLQAIDMLRQRSCCGCLNLFIVPEICAADECEQWYFAIDNVGLGIREFTNALIGYDEDREPITSRVSFTANTMRLRHALMPQVIYNGIDLGNITEAIDIVINERCQCEDSDCADAIAIGVAIAIGIVAYRQNGVWSLVGGALRPQSGYINLPDGKLLFVGDDFLHTQYIITATPSAGIYTSPFYHDTNGNPTTANPFSFGQFALVGNRLWSFPSSTATAYAYSDDYGITWFAVNDPTIVGLIKRDVEVNPYNQTVLFIRTDNTLAYFDTVREQETDIAHTLTDTLNNILLLDRNTMLIGTVEGTIHRVDNIYDTPTFTPIFTAKNDILDMRLFDERLVVHTSDQLLIFDPVGIGSVRVAIDDVAPSFRGVIGSTSTADKIYTITRDEVYRLTCDECLGC